MIYFIVTIQRDRERNCSDYEDYIRMVKPIVERHGGRYLIRSDKVEALQEQWQPDRVIVIAWDTKEQMETCFSSEEYRHIAAKREKTVDSQAIIVEE
ncbi:MAG: DUF1330 domain-containing protein [Oliverpabstia sp.]